MPVIDLIPLDQEGLVHNRPPHETRWSRLTNVSFRDGSLVPRPGFKEAFGYTKQVAVEPAPAQALIELKNPGNNAAGRGGPSWVGEMLRPDGSSSIVAGWSASASTLHGDTDELVPDGAHAVSTTKGSQVSFTFANPAVSYTDILGVRVYLRAMVVATGSNDSEGILTLYQRTGTTNTQFAQVNVWSYQVDEADYWYDYSFLLEKNYNDGQAWELADLNALNIVVEFTSGTSGFYYYLSPESISGVTGWVDAVDGGAAAVGDITVDREDSIASLPDGRRPATLYGSPRTANQLTADDADDIMTVTFADIPAGVTLSTIDAVELLFRVRSEPNLSVAYEIYYNNGSTDTLVTSGSTNADCKSYSEPILSRMTTNPQAGGAWTKTQINAASFKIKIKESKQLTLELATLAVQGTQDTAEVRVDTIAAEVLAPGTDAIKDKLVITNKSMLRYQPEDTTLDNVTNSVASASLPSVMPMDHATLYGQTYVVNGINPTKRYPTGASVFESLTANDGSGANPLTGRTVCAFADRILYGYTRDNTTYTPERVAYSKIRDGGTHNAVSAGTLDIIDSMGGIVALRTLNEGLAFCGKDLGVYALRRTGNSIAPIIVDPIDYETQVLAQHSCVRVLLKGKPVVMFLGMNPSAGLNVFAFDGEKVEPVGNAINAMLEELANPMMFGTAFAGIDIRDNSYVLFLAAGTSIEKAIAYSMNLNTMAWTKWELPYSVYCAGIWEMPSDTRIVFGPSTGHFHGEAFPGFPTLVLGGRNNLALVAHDLPFDTLTPGQGTASQAANDLPGHVMESNNKSAQKSVFTSTLETGDIQLIDPEAGEIQMLSFRLHVDYMNYGPVRIGVSSSVDGGLSFSTEDIMHIGTLEKDGGRFHSLLDLATSVNDRKIRFRLRVLPQNSTFELPFFWQIDRMFLEYQTAGINGA